MAREKGYKHLVDTKAKISFSLRKNWAENDYRERAKKISIALKGHVAWNKGRPWSKLTREKISKGNKGRVPWNKDKKMNAAFRQKAKDNYRRCMGEGNHPRLGKKHTEETKQKLRLIGLGMSIEARKKMGDLHRGKKLSDEHKQKISKALKGRHISWKDKIGMANTGKVRTEETKAKLREIRLKQHFPFKDTKIELLVQRELSNRGYIYSKHYPIIGQPDIAFPVEKIAIFCDGCFWHKCPYHCPNQDKFNKYDKKKTDELQKLGWKVLRFWEHEINDDILAVVNKIETYLD